MHSTRAKKTKSKNRLFLVVILLIFSAAVMGFATYAWIVLSARPTVDGISMNIGSNGGLEIALLFNETYENTALIKASVSDSLEKRSAEEANLTWGNLIDLSSEVYGLDKIKLTPSMLNVISKDGQTYAAHDSYLKTPTFGADGRMTLLEADTVCGASEDDSFYFYTSAPSHGVRAVGNSQWVSAQQRSFFSAYSQVAVNRTLAEQAASLALSENGGALFDIYIRHSLSPSAEYNDADAARLLALALGAEKALDHIDGALRQAAVALAASAVSDASRFETVRMGLLDTDQPLANALVTFSNDLNGSDHTLFNELSELSGELLPYMQDVRSAADACRSLTGDAYSWDDISPVLECLADFGSIYRDGLIFDPSTELTDGAQLTLMPGDGVFTLIAYFVGRYDTYAIYRIDDTERELELSAVTDLSPCRLDSLYDSISRLDPVITVPWDKIKLEDIFGYVIDLAFRTNADDSSLLLQTAAINRIYDDPSGISAQGGGSYMEAWSDQLSEAKIIELMDAVRVSFLDAEGKLLAMAKLGTSSFELRDGKYHFPLYLYQYSLDTDYVIMGERREDQSPIAALPKNTPVIVSVIVWLDGSRVSNSLASYYSGAVSATLNLQFSGSAYLAPANDDTLRETYIDLAP